MMRDRAMSTAAGPGSSAGQRTAVGRDQWWLKWNQNRQVSVPCQDVPAG